MNKKVSSTLKWIGLPLVLLSTLYGAVSMVTLIRRSQRGDDPPAEVLPDVVITRYTIEYKMVQGGKVKEVPDFLFEEGGAYPTSYKYGTAVVVDDLRGRIEEQVADISDWASVVGADNPFYYDDGESVEPLTITVDTGGYFHENTEYEFKGWYLDEGCKTPFKGYFMGEGTTRTLYAKVSTYGWTGFY